MTCWANGASISLYTLRTYLSGGAHRTSDTLKPLNALKPRRSCGPGDTLETYLPSRTCGASRARWSSSALNALGADRTGRALQTILPCWTY